MFEGIKRGWGEARASVLREEFVDLTNRLINPPPAMMAAFCLACLDIKQKLASQYPHPDNLSNKMKAKMAAELRAAGKRNFDTNLGLAYAFFIWSARLEALSLPGPDAQFVVRMSKDGIDLACSLVEAE